MIKGDTQKLDWDNLNRQKEEEYNLFIMEKLNGPLGSLAIGISLFVLGNISWLFSNIEKLYTWMNTTDFAIVMFTLIENLFYYGGLFMIVIAITWAMGILVTYGRR